MPILKAVSAALILTLAGAALAQPGFIDPSFGGGDVLYGPWGTSGVGNLRWVGYQSTGKIVVVGNPYITCTGGVACAYDGAIRYNTDGTLDTAFGQNGSSVVYVPQYPAAAVSAAIQADDGIVILGSGFQVLRLTAGGALDTSFGSGGIVSLAGTNKRIWNAGSVAIQSDGKIVVAGFSAPLSGHDTTWDVTIARFNINGSLDSTFGNFGRGSTPGYIVDSVAGNQQLNRRCLAIQPDGKLVLVDWGTDSPSFVARYLSTGALDTTFGVGGRRTFSITGNDDPQGLVLTGDGRIVVAGKNQTDGITGFVARFTASGSLDATFGTGGATTRAFAQGSGLVNGGIALQPDGGVLVPMSLSSGTNGGDMAVWRLTSSGLSDPAFGPTGDGVSQLVGLTNTFDDARGITVDPLGRIIIAGSAGGIGPEVVAIRGQ